MRVAIAGGHGNIALRLTRRLSERGDEVTSLIRNPAHAEDVRAAGGAPVVCDLEQAGAQELADAVGGADAVVFAAGAGPGSGAERKLTMDRDGAVKLLDAARAADVGRYLIVNFQSHWASSIWPFHWAYRTGSRGNHCSGGPVAIADV